MFLDNRRILPLGARLIESAAGEKAIAMWAIFDNGERILIANLEKAHKVKYYVQRDFMSVVPDKEAPWTFTTHPTAKTAKAHHEKNMGWVDSYNHETAETVILCGAGTFEPDEINQYRDRAKVITVGRAQVNLQGDYYVGLETLPHAFLDSAGNENTIAHLMTTCHETAANQNWKALTWGSYRFLYDGQDIPVYHPHENVTCMAFEFACNVLKAKKIILCGMDHPALTNGKLGYFWHGVELQSMAWWAATHGVEVWNCTKVSTVISSMFLGELNEAFAG